MTRPEKLGDRNVVLKDLDLRRKLYVGRDMEDLLTMQLAEDVRFLMGQQVMDYSFLVGIRRYASSSRQGQRRHIAAHPHRDLYPADQGPRWPQGSHT